jgi:hypothetical protein
VHTTHIGSTRKLVILALALAVLGACGDDDHENPPPAPQILNINNATAPASPVGVSIEINGSDFGSAPGRVDFAQGDNVAAIAPDAAGWSPTGVIVTVPASGAGGTFTVPGSVLVTLVTEGGTSNAVELELVSVPTFSVSNVQWATTTALPTALRGLRGAAVPNTTESAYVILAGGNDGTDNVATVYSTMLDPEGSLGSWTPTAALPAARAHHAIAIAHPGNAPVAAEARHVYVIGGQEAVSVAPGGTATVYVGSVSLDDGTVSGWSETTSIPEALVGASAVLYNGYLYVLGGLRPDGTPTDGVHSARVGTDGMLGAWTTSANPYAAPVAFATAFGFGGNLYVLGGETASSGDPNAQGGAGTKMVRHAPIRWGVVGAWGGAADLVKQRKKHVTWTAFGQTLAAEGVYEGAAGSLELERSSIEPNGAFAAWNGITSTANQINANVYNAAAIVSPLRSASGAPRFLLIGGQKFVTMGAGELSSAVYRNTAP